MAHVRLGTFTRSVLLEVARRTGRLAAAGLTVSEEGVPSSPAQFRSLADGEYDAVVTSPDNVLAYRFVAANPLQTLFDVVITAGLDGDAGLSLCVRPGLESLTGARAGVDVATSGFAFATYGLLDLAGVARDDYEVVALGSSPKRVSALAEGRCDVTILGAGNELAAQAAGCSVHSRVTALGPYVGEVVARLADAPGADAADQLATVLVETADAVRAGEHAEETVAAAQDLLGLPPALAEAHHARLASTGLLPEGRVPREAVRTLVELRGRYHPGIDPEEVMDSLDALCLHHAGR